MAMCRLIAARKEKNITQNDMAELLFISQSQYQRRECGKIRISDKEWKRMAEILDKRVEDIKREDNNTTINNYNNYSESYLTDDNYHYNIPKFVMENQQDIEMLKEEIRNLKEEIDYFRNIHDIKLKSIINL